MNNKKHKRVALIVNDNSEKTKKLHNLVYIIQYSLKL